MTSQRISTILDELRVEEADIQQNLDQLRAQVKDDESRLAQVRKALSSLKGKPQNGSAVKKPTATKHEVVEAITHVLREKGPVSEDELKTIIENLLSSQGKSRTGLAMRFKNALREKRFARIGNSLSLASHDEVVDEKMHDE